ncbi:C40 family peptidase [Apilactobacillus kunkeei]|uniref:Cell wall-associated hydrolase n=1 Tax=Apilactobacillus kunkeei DSM 12361 = ATCC 700308 TaxID=1423768 RepID=A0A0R1FKU4_9LACO|nr:NlpC/P60 family protein [Apilactobacillus kunkeei]KOY72809.1 Cell wall-associated hydrolase [Apilactobacillus kunkeei DSM 12361 = ATCC 700308]KRK22558.1 cell wall-associated hydrolase [Apilactobacillus kunkeei DSM 12361 = ATCC 700308]
MNKTKTKKTIMLIMLTVLAMATLFATDVTNASASKVHHKRTHKVYKKKKAKKKHVAKKPNHKKKARKVAYKKPAAKKKAHKVVKKARKSGFSSLYRSASSKLGHPYVYGAVGPYSFDCSGFTQYAYRHGKHKYLARTAQMQYNTNRHVSRKNVKKGDLVFFGTSRSNIYHVGIYIGHDRMIDAQNRGVVTEKIHVPWWHEVGYARVA